MVAQKRLYFRRRLRRLMVWTSNLSVDLVAGDGYVTPEGRYREFTDSLVIRLSLQLTMHCQARTEQIGAER